MFGNFSGNEFGKTVTHSPVCSWQPRDIRMGRNVQKKSIIPSPILHIFSEGDQASPQVCRANRRGKKPFQNKIILITPKMRKWLMGWEAEHVFKIAFGRQSAESGDDIWSHSPGSNQWETLALRKKKSWKPCNYFNIFPNNLTMFLHLRVYI